MNGVISSSWTFFHKFFCGALWVLLFGGLTLIAFIPQLSSGTDLNTPLVQSLFLISTFVGIALHFWLLAPLKRVEVKRGLLRISNFATTIEVPLSNVKLVSGSILLNPELIWIQFKDTTEFGKKIVFMGKYRLFRGFSIHPIVKELKQEIAARR